MSVDKLWQIPFTPKRIRLLGRVHGVTCYATELLKERFSQHTGLGHAGVCPVQGGLAPQACLD